MTEKPDATVIVEVDEDGAAATRRALGHAAPARTAVWVGRSDDDALAEFREEIGRAR